MLISKATPFRSTSSSLYQSSYKLPYWLVLELLQDYVAAVCGRPFHMREIRQLRRVCRCWKQVLDHQFALSIRISNPEALSRLVRDKSIVSPFLKSLSIQFELRWEEMGWYSKLAFPLKARSVIQDFDKLQELFKQAEHLEEVAVDVKFQEHPADWLNGGFVDGDSLPVSFYTTLLTHCKQLKCLWKGYMPAQLPLALQELQPNSTTMSPSETLISLLPNLDRAEIRMDGEGLLHHDYIPNVSHIIVFGSRSSCLHFMTITPAHLTNIQTLELSRVPPEIAIFHSQRRTPCTTFHTVTRLGFPLAREGLPEADAFFTLFPNLQELYIDGVMSFNTEILRTRCQALTKLRVRIRGAQDLCRLFSLLNLTHLALDYIRWRDDPDQSLPFLPGRLRFPHLSHLYIPLREPLRSGVKLEESGDTAHTRKLIRDLRTPGHLEGCPLLTSVKVSTLIFTPLLTDIKACFSKTFEVSRSCDKGSRLVPVTAYDECYDVPSNNTRLYNWFQ